MNQKIHSHTFVEHYEGLVGFGFDRETDEKSLMVYLQKFSDDALLAALVPRLSDDRNPGGLRSGFPINQGPPERRRIPSSVSEGRRKLNGFGKTSLNSMVEIARTPPEEGQISIRTPNIFSSD